uniref:Uncharacterized protein n=1 Tax=Avena sativa TaxID=4498 RepID=A0ACD6A2S0_AVESA
MQTKSDPPSAFSVSLYIYCGTGGRWFGSKQAPPSVVPMEMVRPEQGARRVSEEEQEAALVHSQVRKIKQEDEKARELLHRLRLREARPTTVIVDFREPVRRAPPSPLRRTGQAISVLSM